MIATAAFGDAAGASCAVEALMTAHPADSNHTDAATSSVIRPQYVFGCMTLSDVESMP